ncbi:MAG: DUF805 domain-containing protein [Burkholderiales bacterium]
MSWFILAIRKAFNIDGRSRRAEYWWFTLWLAVFVVTATIFDVLLGTFYADSGMGFLGGLVVLTVVVPGFTLQVRRLHDIGRSGWWSLLGLTGIGGLLLVGASLFNSQTGANQWGMSPKVDADGNRIDERPPHRWSTKRRVTTGFFIAVTVVGLLTILGMNKLEQTKAEVNAHRDTHAAIGLAFGRDADERGCFVEAVERYKALESRSMAVQVLHSIETTNCLNASKPSKDFCKNVPLRSAIMESAQWANQTCANLGMQADHNCINMIKPFAEYCNSSARASKTNGAVSIPNCPPSC